MKLEYFRIGMEGGSTSSYAGIGTLAAGEWVQITTDTPDIQTGGTRGVFDATAPVGNLDYINISTTGNAIDFGSAQPDSRTTTCACSSTTRGLFMGGKSPETANIFQVTIASTGSVADFNGDLVIARRNAGGAGNQTRGLALGGWGPSYSPGTGEISEIDYVTIASNGNAQSFGDLIELKEFVASFASQTRAVVAGGAAHPGVTVNTIEFVTISTQGNGADFGDLLESQNGSAGCSNSVRGIHWGGRTTPSPQAHTTNMDFITLATLGNSTNFGDHTATGHLPGFCASSTRAVFAGGYEPASPSVTNRIEYVQIMSLGDTIDFGDLTSSRQRFPGLSNGHGGLG
jgi:hypothetical protein